jgi:uncharacterized protein (TIGR02453 family)
MAVTSTFAGFSPDAIQFMADLAANNDRAWFQPRKGDYERLVKEPMELLMVALAERFEARGIPLVADPKRSPFRIYRDTRFSRDKSPYKTHIGASMPWVGGTAGSMPAPGAGPSEGTDEGAHGNGAYFNFQPGEMYAGGGMWMAEKPRLDAFRRSLVDDPDRVRAALEDPAFVATFGGAHTHESLKRVPPGYAADHPEADRLRWKDIVFGRRLTDAEVGSPSLPDLLADDYATAVPVFRFLAGLG